MTDGDEIDTNFDFKKECPGKDADSYSRTLRRYHRILWSKPLPNGTRFDLVEAGTKGRYHLHHMSALGEWWLKSDAITTRLLGKAAHAIAQVPPYRVPTDPGYTIGSAILFPGTRRNGKTINGARGFHPGIADRFDLTLECIRLHYLGKPSPLDSTLCDFADFFDLFGDFAGYVDFWLLQDLVDEDGVRFWMPFNGFRVRSAVPQDAECYIAYIDAVNGFIRDRNRRIDASAKSLPPHG